MSETRQECRKHARMVGLCADPFSELSRIRTAEPLARPRSRSSTSATVSHTSIQAWLVVLT